MMVRSRLKVLIAERNVVRLREGKKVLTQRDIAISTGLPLSVVSGLASNRASQVAFKTLDKLSAFFDVPPGELLERVVDDSARD